MGRGYQSLERALRLFEVVVANDGAKPVTALAQEVGLPSSSARRMLMAFAERGLVRRVARGKYSGGERLAQLYCGMSPHRILVESARGPLHRLALATKGTAHCGVFEGDMVTYVIKEGQATFTREGNQLEAYCTGIGKALLAQLPLEDLKPYLQDSFVPLTEQTITSPEALKEELERTRQRGFSIDDREISDDIYCVAVPIGASYPGAAISLSFDQSRAPQPEMLATKLTVCAKLIADRIAKRCISLEQSETTNLPVISEHIDH